MAVKKKKQSKRFIEKARELGADESGEAFEHAVEKIIPPQHGMPEKPRETDKRKLRDS